MIRAALLSLALAAPAHAGVLEGDSPDPVAELNAFYTKVCHWTQGETIPVETADITHDGVDDYVVTYDLACRGQEDAFTGSMGTARQVWVSRPDGTFLRVFDANALGLRFETRDGHDLLIIQHRGDYCLGAPSAPCFLTLELTENALIWAPAELQHPSITPRLQMLEDAAAQSEEETSND